MKKYLLILMLFFTAISVYSQTGPAQDFDGDGVINSADLDDDNDGILDTAECGSTNSTLTNGFGHPTNVLFAGIHSV